MLRTTLLSSISHALRSVLVEVGASATIVCMVLLEGLLLPSTPADGAATLPRPPAYDSMLSLPTLDASAREIDPLSVDPRDPLVLCTTVDLVATRTKVPT